MTGALIGLLTLVGSLILNTRHQRRVRRLDARRHRVIAVPTALLKTDRPLTFTEAEALKAEWLKHRNDPPTWLVSP